MMKIGIPSQPPHHPDRISSGLPSEALPSFADTNQFASGAEALEDHTQITVNTSSHSSEPTQIQFFNMSDAHTEIQNMLDLIQQVENQNIQTLLDSIQASLDKARKMMEENMRYFYEKLRPQMDSIQKLLNQLSQQKERMQQDDILKHITNALNTLKKNI